jgi:hypothetical protein
MLTAAALGMAIYGVYSAGLGLVDLFGVYGLDWWADLGLVVLGSGLLFSAALVRVRMPGGLALAIGVLLFLQMLALHDDVHFYGAILVAPQVTRGVIGAALTALAFWGARMEREREERKAARGGSTLPWSGTSV